MGKTKIRRWVMGYVTIFLMFFQMGSISAQAYSTYVLPQGNGAMTNGTASSYRSGPRQFGPADKTFNTSSTETMNRASAGSAYGINYQNPYSYEYAPTFISPPSQNQSYMNSNYGFVGQEIPNNLQGYDYRYNNGIQFEDVNQQNFYRNPEPLSSEPMNSSLTYTEAQLIDQLNPQVRSIYASLNPEQKALAIRLSSQDIYRNKNLAVKEAQRRVNERPGVQLYR